MDTSYIKAYINFNEKTKKAFIDSHSSSNQSKISETVYNIKYFLVYNGNDLKRIELNQREKLKECLENQHECFTVLDINLISGKKH